MSCLSLLLLVTLMISFAAEARLADNPKSEEISRQGARADAKQACVMKADLRLNYESTTILESISNSPCWWHVQVKLAEPNIICSSFLNNHLEAYRRTAICRMKNIMVCKGCNSALSGVTMSAQMADGVQIWCFDHGSFAKKPKVAGMWETTEDVSTALAHRWQSSWAICEANTKRVRHTEVLATLLNICVLAPSLKIYAFCWHWSLQADGENFDPWTFQGDWGPQLQKLTLIVWKNRNDQLWLLQF